MQSSGVCFVVSPIGEDGSNIRRHADDVFDLLVEPALQPFNFNVIRADKIPGPSSITEDVIRLVQESELCIADLTERNPNVFYECGRRHETGKPMILMIRKGDKIPFDLAGIRTIAYDLSDTRKARESVLLIQEYVREVEKSGFAESSSGATLTTVIDAIARIERKLNASPLIASNMPAVAGSQSARSGSDLMRSPKALLHQALMTGDLQTIVQVLSRIERTAGYSLGVVTAATAAAINGERVGVELLIRALQSEDAGADWDVKKSAATGAVQYYINTDRYEEGSEVLPPIVQTLINKLDDVKLKAFLHNQLQMLFYGARKYAEALEHAEAAIELDPDPSYFYNVSMVYEQLNLPRKAVEAIEACLAGRTEDDPDHLSQAYDIYRESGLTAKADAILVRLRLVDPALATYKTRM